jgi:hypothetical protein
VCRGPRVQYQVVHDECGLAVWILLRPAAPAETPEQIRAALHRELAAAGAVPPPVTVTPVTDIAREPGHAAKFKIIKSAR